MCVLLFFSDVICDKSDHLQGGKTGMYINSRLKYYTTPQLLIFKDCKGRFGSDSACEYPRAGKRLPLHFGKKSFTINYSIGQNVDWQIIFLPNATTTISYP